MPRYLHVCAIALLAGCGSRLSDGDIQRFCDLELRCGAITDTAVCISQLQDARTQAAMIGCSGPLNDAARCVIRDDTCTPACDAQDARLQACLDRSRPDGGSGTSRPNAVVSCSPGAAVSVGCASACSLGSCTGDSVLRICDGSTGVAACAAATSDTDAIVIAHNDDGSSCGGGLCSFVDLVCPASGSIAVTHHAFGSGAYSCDWDVR